METNFTIKSNTDGKKNTAIVRNMPGATLEWRSMRTTWLNPGHSLRTNHVSGMLPSTSVDYGNGELQQWNGAAHIEPGLNSLIVLC
jgi:hypothetical protein